MAQTSRRLTGATDPVKGGSNTGKAKKAGVPVTPRGTPKGAKTSADKNFTNERAKFLREEGAKKKGRSVKSILQKRLKRFKEKTLKNLEAKNALRIKFRKARHRVSRANLVKQQKASLKNLQAKNKARMMARAAAAPRIVDGKVRTPKPEPVAVQIVKPKLDPMPWMKKGQIMLTKKPKPPKKDPTRKAAARKAAKTKARGKVEVK